jgi:hypothetical protein
MVGDTTVLVLWAADSTFAAKRIGSRTGALEGLFDSSISEEILLAGSYENTLEGIREATQRGGPFFAGVSEQRPGTIRIDRVSFRSATGNRSSLGFHRWCFWSSE